MEVYIVCCETRALCGGIDSVWLYEKDALNRCIEIGGESYVQLIEVSGPIPWRVEQEL